MYPGAAWNAIDFMAIGGYLVEMAEDVLSLIVDFARSDMAVQAPVDLTEAKHEDKWNSEKGGYEGTDGLIYKIPRSILPSAPHARRKKRNIIVTMENLRGIALEDQLPCTREEKRFFREYRHLQVRLWLYPFAVGLPLTYVGFRASQRFLWMWLRGRLIPFLVAATFAESMQMYMYPAHDLISQVLSARTPMGDAARAEWQRLHAVDISFAKFAIYSSSALFGEIMAGFKFGDDVREIEKVW